MHSLVQSVLAPLHGGLLVGLAVGEARDAAGSAAEQAAQVGALRACRVNVGSCNVREQRPHASESCPGADTTQRQRACTQYAHLLVAATLLGDVAPAQGHRAARQLNIKHAIKPTRPPHRALLQRHSLGALGLENLQSVGCMHAGAQGRG